jgi:amino acid transporter
LAAISNRTITSEPGRLSRYVVPATIMLSFVSFWRAAAIVLSDLGSTAYYIGGIAEKAIGKAAPWFILGIMLFSYAVRAVYVESCSMFVRGGVYRVVREAMGGTAAKFSVSALMFDYVLTGPISAVSAGLYLAGLINQAAGYLHYPQIPIPTPYLAALFALAVTIYFWWTNTLGVPYSSGKALRIMQITTVMVVLLIGWCLLTILMKGYHPVAPPTMANLKFSNDALGWLKGTIAPSITAIAILIGLGHSLLAMSGEESLAQVNREIEHPKHRNLMRTGLIIFVYSLCFTSLVSFFAVMIIPDAERPKYFDNLISGLSMFLVGPETLRLLFQGFVVLVGTLILSGAVNTSIIGSNGVLNRVAEDGVLPAWFRQPHPKYGTTYRIINLIVGLQLVTILISRGDVFLLGEAYAFGVAWSFFMKSLAVMVLRFTEPKVERWKVPFNIRVRGVDLPIGLAVITILLFLMAAINVLTKTTATISGAIFTVVFFVAFSLSERYYKPKDQHKAEAHEDKGQLQRHEESETELFRLEVREHLSPKSLGVRPGNILVAVRDFNNLSHLEKVLEESDPAQADVVVVSVNPDYSDTPPGHPPKLEQVISQHEIKVFSKAVYVAERAGKPIHLFAVPGRNVYELVLLAASRIRSARIVMSLSERVSAEDQEREIAEAWEELARPRPELSVEIMPDGEEAPWKISLRGHLVLPSSADRDLAHLLWKKLLPKMTPPATLHEGDVFGIALRRLAADLRSENVQAVDEIRQEVLLRDVAANGYSPEMLSRPK